MSEQQEFFDTSMPTAKISSGIGGESVFLDVLDTRLHLWVTIHCTCGGGGPTDYHTCPSCHVWHEYNRWKN